MQELKTQVDGFFQPVKCGQATSDQTCTPGGLIANCAMMNAGDCPAKKGCSYVHRATATCTACTVVPSVSDQPNSDCTKDAKGDASSTVCMDILAPTCHDSLHYPATCYNI